MIWLIRLYLFLMAVVYGVIGVWALLDPFLDALELGYPSFLNAVGLSISSPIGYSEIAGLYGGLNFFIGLMCIIGIFNKNIGIFSIKFITFLVGSIATGRVLFSLFPSAPDFFSYIFLFEFCTFLVGLFFLIYIKLNQST